MAVLRRAALLVALLAIVTSAVPVPLVAHEPLAQLRGASRAIAAGEDGQDSAIESRSVGGTREIAVSVDVGDAPDAEIRSRLRAAGLTLRGTWRTTIEGFIEPSRLQALARVAAVRSITPIRRPLESGFVGPAPAIHGATLWQQAGYTGAGVKIGILDSFAGIAAMLGSELPSTVAARCYAEVGKASTNLEDCVSSSGSAHGTAVAESIIDMAPGASLYISNARSPADWAAAVDWMTAAGVRIINLSSASPVLLEGMGDGRSPYKTMTYALVDQAVSGGALLVASAGNQGTSSWQDVPADADADGWMEFAPGDEGNRVELEAGERIAVAVRWASAASDYDISIWQGDSKLEESADRQAVSRDPLEIIDFTVPETGTYEIRIAHPRGPVAPLLRLLVWSDGEADLAHRTTAGSLAAPADSLNRGMVSVGAVDYRTPSVVETYSSQGPTLDGRIKPDLVAVDCSATITYTVFCGTSQAAPFVTGAAALLVESNPGLTPVQLADYLRSHAMGLGSPIPNNQTGFGLLSLGALPAQPASLAFLAPAASGGPGTPFLGQPVVGILDSAGQLVTRGPGLDRPITLSIATNPGGGTLGCPTGLTGNATAGIVRFEGCSIDLPGSGYTLRADAPGLTGVTGAPFAVAVAAAPPSVTLVGSATTVTYGAALGLTGQVALPGGAGVVVELERGAAGIYAGSGTSTTDAAGVARWSVKPLVNASYRMRLTTTATGLVEVSAPVNLRVNATASLRASTPSGRTITRRSTLTLTTTIRPIGADAARGRARFDVMQRTSSGWVRRNTVYANADSSGGCKVSIRLPATGSWWIRSRAEPTATNGASIWTSGVKYTVNR